MNSRIVFAFFLVFILAVPSVLAQWSCPFSYGCGKRQVNDEVTLPRSRLANRLRSLRNSRPPEEGRSNKEEKDERRLGNIADPKGSWE
ncbi:hypothetical protein ACROYT_G023849 [Oculina patagonica]